MTFQMNTKFGKSFLFLFKTVIGNWPTTPKSIRRIRFFLQDYSNFNFCNSATNWKHNIFGEIFYENYHPHCRVELRSAPSKKFRLCSLEYLPMKSCPEWYRKKISIANLHLYLANVLILLFIAFSCDCSQSKDAFPWILFSIFVFIHLRQHLLKESWMPVLYMSCQFR